jgi:hypothetical protein
MVSDYSRGGLSRSTLTIGARGRRRAGGPCPALSLARRNHPASAASLTGLRCSLLKDCTVLHLASFCLADAELRLEGVDDPAFTALKVKYANVLTGAPPGRATSVVFARKPDGSWRICCDYLGLGLNAVTRPAVEPLPHIEALLDGMRG